MLDIVTFANLSLLALAVYAVYKVTGPSKSTFSVDQDLFNRFVAASESLEWIAQNSERIASYTRRIAEALEANSKSTTQQWVEKPAQFSRAEVERGLAGVYGPPKTELMVGLVPKSDIEAIVDKYNAITPVDHYIKSKAQA